MLSVPGDVVPLVLCNMESRGNQATLEGSDAAAVLHDLVELDLLLGMLESCCTGST